jgi:hypothetical protein
MNDKLSDIHEIGELFHGKRRISLTDRKTAPPNRLHGNSFATGGPRLYKRTVLASCSNFLDRPNCKKRLAFKVTVDIERFLSDKIHFTSNKEELIFGLNRKSALSNIDLNEERSGVGFQSTLATWQMLR